MGRIKQFADRFKAPIYPCLDSDCRDFDAQCHSRCDEGTIFECSDGAEDIFRRDGQSCGLGVKLDQVAGCLHTGLQHQHPGHDRKSWKVVLQVFLCAGDRLQGHDAPGGVVKHAIDEVEMHEWRRISRKPLAGRGALE